jgi:hypothetical protein
MYSPTDVIMVIKSRIMGLEGHAWKVSTAQNVFVWKPEGNSHLKDLGTDGNIILKLI